MGKIKEYSIEYHDFISLYIHKQFKYITIDDNSVDLTQSFQHIIYDDIKLSFIFDNTIASVSSKKILLYLGDKIINILDLNDIKINVTNYIRLKKINKLLKKWMCMK